MQPLIVENPFEKMGIDLLGPLPKTKDGNKYIIVAVDHFTKWAVTKALPKAIPRRVAAGKGPEPGSNVNWSGLPWSLPAQDH